MERLPGLAAAALQVRIPAEPEAHLRDTEEAWYFDGVRSSLTGWRTIVVMGDRLAAVMDGHQIGVNSYRKTKQNLGLAFSLNGIGVPAATTGLVSPVWAMVAMITSVTAVLANVFWASTRLVWTGCEHFAGRGHQSAL